MVYLAEWRVDTIAPLHHNAFMRLTVNLEPDVYVVARSLASAEECSISTAVNRLLRRALRGFEGDTPPRSDRPAKRNGFPISRGRQPVTAGTVRQIEAEDDRA